MQTSRFSRRTRSESIKSGEAPHNTAARWRKNALKAHDGETRLKAARHACGGSAAQYEMQANREMLFEAMLCADCRSRSLPMHCMSRCIAANAEMMFLKRQQVGGEARRKKIAEQNFAEGGNMFSFGK